MSLLLDTHAFLWMVDDPQRLAPAARAAVSESSTDLHLSIASIWELAIKAGLGKLELPFPIGEFVSTRLARTRTDVLAISTAHAVAVAGLPRHHGDPFDRMLVAQARADGLTLVSADPAFRLYDVPVLWA